MKYHLFTFSLFILYVLVATGIMIWQGIGIAPDRYIFLLLFVSLLLKKGRAFLLDWLPFLFLLISFDFLRGLVPLFNNNVHYWELIQADLTIFKVIPTQFLQKHFFNPNSLGLHDYLATILYFLHFVPPTIFAFILWLNNKSYFRKFTLGLLILSYSAWITFFIFPASPPWLAAKEGYLDGVVKIMDTTINVFPEKISLPTIYHKMHPNPVAAIPSLHNAYPFLILLFVLQFFKAKGLFFLPYVLGVMVSTVYLGEHYVIDVLAGFLYAFLSFLVAIRAPHSVKFLKVWLKKATGKFLI